MKKRNDFNLMVEWLNDQKVLEFYDEPPTNLEVLNQKYGPRVEGNGYVIPCIEGLKTTNRLYSIL